MIDGNAAPAGITLAHVPGQLQILDQFTAIMRLQSFF